MSIELVEGRNASNPLDLLEEILSANEWPFDRSSNDEHYLTDNPQRRCPDLAKLRSLGGWTPTVPLREGLARTLASYRGTAA